MSATIISYGLVFYISPEKAHADAGMLSTTTTKGKVNHGFLSNIAGLVRVEYQRPEAPESDPGLLLASALQYKLSDSLSLNTVLAYSHTMSRYDDQRDGFEDIDVYSEYDNLFKIDSFGTDIFLGTRLPTSQTSIKTSLNLASYLGFELKNKFGKWFILRSKNTAYLYNYRYQEANVAGTVYNERYGLRTQWIAEVPIAKEFSVDIEGNYYQSENYANTIKSVRGFIFTANYFADPKIRLYADYSTRDRKISNNDLFDKDNTTYTLGADYVF